MGSNITHTTTTTHTNNNAHNNKKKRPASELTLEEHIVARRRCLVDARAQVPLLRQQASELRADADAMVLRYESRRACDNHRLATEIEREADERESMVREHEFERYVVCYLRMYHTRARPATTLRKSDAMEQHVHHTATTNSRRAAILEEYVTHIHSAPPKVAMAVRDECVRCVGTKLLLCSSKSTMTCPQCGYTVSYLDATSLSTSFDDVVEFSQYSYKRVNHYLMWLSLVQGKEAHVVGDEVLEAVMTDLLHKQHIRTPTDVTQRRVRETLRRLKLRRAYDHVAQITSRISGVRAPRIPTDVEDQLKNMFLQMQPAFYKHAPKTRTNFLSYSYVLYRCFQILGLHHMLDCITLLKGRDKLEANDAIFRKMCETLGWPIFALPPACETTR